MNVYASIVGPSPSSAQYYCPNEPQQIQFNGGIFPQNMSTIICIENRQQSTIADQQQTFFYYSPDQQFQQQVELVESTNFPHQQPKTIIYGPSIDPPQYPSIVPIFGHQIEQQNYVQTSQYFPIPIHSNSNHSAINMKNSRKVGFIPMRVIVVSAPAILKNYNSTRKKLFDGILASSDRAIRALSNSVIYKAFLISQILSDIKVGKMIQVILIYLEACAIPATMPPNPIQKQNLYNFIICPECSQRFPQQETFNAHFETCWVEAVEKEHRQLLLENTFKLPTNERQRKKGEMEQIVNLSTEKDDYITLENGRRKQKIMPGNINETDIEKEEEDDGNPPKLFPACQDEMPILNEEVIDEQPTMPLSNSIKNLSNYEHQILINSPPKSTSRIECPLCGFQLYRHNLGPHLRIHSGELPFPCTFCPKKFRTTSAMKVHHRTHTGERPYKCSFCVYACTTKRNLDRHIGNRHQQYYQYY